MRKKIRTVLAFVAVNAMVVFMAYRLSPPTPDSRAPLLSDFPHAHGVVLGQTIAADLPAGGEVLVLCFQNFGPLQDLLTKRRIEGLRAGLGARFRVRVTGTAKQETPDLDVLFAGKRFDRWILDAPATVAVVSFVGLPVDVTPATLGSWPPFYCGMLGPSSGWETLLKNGRLRAVTQLRRADRRESEWRPGLTHREVFDLQFRLLRPADTL
jgi:hypothetical protein